MGGYAVHEKSDLPEAFLEHCTCEFGVEYGTPSFTRKKIEFGYFGDILTNWPSSSVYLLINL